MPMSVRTISGSAQAQLPFQLGIVAFAGSRHSNSGANVGKAVKDGAG